MAGNGQFNEVYPIVGSAFFDSTYTPPTREQVTASGGNPGRVDTLLAFNLDTVAHILQVYVGQASSPSFFGQVSVPAGAGFGGAPFFDVLAAIVPTTQQGLWYPAGSEVWVSLVAAPAVGTDVNVASLGGTL